MLSSLDSYFASARAREDAWALRVLQQRGASQADVLAVIADENARRAEFERKVRQRVRRDVTKALSLGTPAERQGAVLAVLGREENYAAQRSVAMAERSLALADRLVLRRESPQGAWWALGEAEQHTADCLAMAGHFWPWDVLDSFHPPTHAGCRCSLHGYAQAIAAGLMSPGDVPDTADARRRAAAAKLLLHEDAVLEMGLALVRVGVLPSIEDYDLALWASATRGLRER